MNSTKHSKRFLATSLTGSSRRGQAALILAVSAITLTALPHARAGSAIEWANIGSEWATGSNWVGDIAPLTADNVVFGSTGASAKTVSMASSKTTSGITFNAGAYAYTITKTGGNLTIGSMGITNNATNTETFNGTYILNNGQTWTTVSGGLLQINGSVDMNAASTASRTLYVSGEGNTTFNGTIKNTYAGSTGNLNVSATGTVTLSGANTYNGTTTLNTATGTLLITGTNTSAGATTLTAGSLQLGSESNGGLASGALTLTGGTLEAVDRSITLSNAVTFGGTTIVGSQDLTLNGTLTGNTGADRTLTNNIDSGKTLTLNNVNINNQATVRNLTIAGTGNTTINGVIADGAAQANGLIIASTGVTTIAGTATYTGPTSVTGGKLIVSGAISGTVTVGNGATLAGGANLTSTVGTVLANAGATVLPGDADSTGTLNTAALTLADGTTHLGIELGTVTASDQIVTSAISPVAVTLGGAALDISLLGSYSHVGGERFLIINNQNDASTLLEQFASGTSQIVVRWGDTTETFDVLYNAKYDEFGVWQADTGGNDLALMAVPEPSTWAFVVGGIGMLGCLRRRSRRSLR